MSEGSSGPISCRDPKPNFVIENSKLLPSRLETRCSGCAQHASFEAGWRRFVESDASTSEIVFPASARVRRPGKISQAMLR